MPISVRLDEETEEKLVETAEILKTNKTEVLKASIREFCTKTLRDKSRKPYDLIKDLIGTEHSGKGNLAIGSEKILREAFTRKK